MKALRKKYLLEGWYYAALDAIATGGAPMLMGPGEKIILLDDLLVHPIHGVRFCDGKFKDHTDFFQKGEQRSMSTDGRLRQWQHGIDRHHWDHYRRLQDLSKIPGQLSLLVLKPGVRADPNPHHLWQSLDELEKHAEYSGPHTNFRTGAAYFPMGTWKCSPIDFIAPAELPSLARSVHPWEEKSKAGAAPAWLIQYCDDSPFERCAANLDLPLFVFDQQRPRA
jgi:hypothetical protein